MADGAQTAAPTEPGPEPALPPPPTLSGAGLEWSACSFFTSAYPYSHRWAEGLVPPEYRQANTLAGNLGQASLQAFSCEGAAVGNQTFLKGFRFAYLGVLVEPPPGLVHPEGNFYLLDLFVTDAAVAAQLAAAGAPVRAGRVEVGDGAVAVDAPESAAEVTVLHRDPAAQDATLHLRLHWATPAAHCFVDLEHIASEQARSQSVLRGDRGNPAAVAGPLQRLEGLSSHGVESGSLDPLRCLAP
jgi:hypothetical protein